MECHNPIAEDVVLLFVVLPLKTVQNGVNLGEYMNKKKHGGFRQGSGRPKIAEPRTERKMISWTKKEWELIEKFGGDDLAKFQRDAILNMCE